MIKRNLTLLMDFYEMTMANGYLENGMKDKIVYFDMFFRRIPDDGGFVIMAGLEQLIEYIEGLRFDESDISYLRGKKKFSEEFLDYLKNFKFECDIWSVPEGTPIFPNEPVITVRGPIMQAQLIETMLLITINHQTLIATKANRIVRAAGNRPIMEFGSRRAQGYDAAIYGARAAYIGGCVATACTLSDKEFGVEAVGTMAHSFVQLFDTEIDAFRAYAKLYPDDCVLLVDTYNVLKSGIPNAIKVFNEELLPRGFRPKGVRIDSGDLVYLSKKARKMLDEAGFDDCKIVVSNALDEYLIKEILDNGAKIDSFGVGERLITSKTDPVFGGVYKLCAVEENRGGNIEIIPKIKISENEEKITNPGVKTLWRIFDKATKKALADVITLNDEVIDESSPYVLFDPEHTWKKKTVHDFVAKKLRQRIFEKGKCVYERPELLQIRKYCKKQINTLWSEVLRFNNPHKYYVDLSYNLWSQKKKLLDEYN